EPEKIITPIPLSLVQQQLNAYNARNIEAFLAPYAEDVELYDFPDKLMGKGKESMRKIYGQMFATLPDLHCEIKERIIQGNTVIDHERVRIRKNSFVEATAIYKIENGKIQKVYFIH
ncbi:MAG TPA: nuclear transport factor 2 family protein, partial [Flavobacterium sp.]|nr:nuclear transport factor 2 family protein [Flavobacterium sp.]